GHALVMRYYGLRPWITLHGLGGLAGYDTTDLMRSRASGWIAQIIISLAGPGAGFLMAAVIVAVLFASGGGVVPKFFEPPYGFFLIPQGIVSMRLLTLTWALLFVGVTWGLVNLLPIYPLDGGQVAREIFLRFNPRNGLRYSLILSTIAGATMVAICLLPVVQSIRAGLPLLTSLRNGSPFVALLFGYLAYSSYSVLQAMFRPRGPW
ncbi:MAG: hypothetical protein JW818_03870, partial [Pirellulales bacterium]|nr:hypothetical protein [Pirellulales bacterium]